MRLRRIVQRLKNHFELFGLQPAFALDVGQLERAYREIQARIHPDRFAHAGDAERRASMQWTTQVNEAYRTLKSPVLRGRYLLALRGVDVGAESNTVMSPEFLAQQMEWREALAEASAGKDGGAVERLRGDLRRERAALAARIADCLDGSGDAAAAAELLRKLMFLEKFDADIDEALETIES